MRMFGGTGPGLRTRVIAAIAAPLVGVMVLAGCGSGTSAGTAPSSAPAAASSAAAPASGSTAASGAGTVISTAKGTDGTYLVGAGGRAVYLWVADTSSTSTCSGSCAAVWPPVTTKGAPSASGTAVAGKLGTTKRSDGTEQVTYAGHPLYYYASDSGPGKVTGQGSDGFGAKWWLVSPSGSAITSGGSGASPSSAATSKSSGGSWG